VTVQHVAVELWGPVNADECKLLEGMTCQVLRGFAVNLQCSQPVSLPAPLQSIARSPTLTPHASLPASAAPSPHCARRLPVPEHILCGVRPLQPGAHEWRAGRACQHMVARRTHPAPVSGVGKADLAGGTTAIMRGRVRQEVWVGNSVQGDGVELGVLGDSYVWGPWTHPAPVRMAWR
jgi:hypothetical protein